MFCAKLLSFWRALPKLKRRPPFFITWKGPPSGWLSMPKKWEFYSSPFWRKTHFTEKTWFSSFRNGESQRHCKYIKRRIRSPTKIIGCFKDFRTKFEDAGAQYLNKNLKMSAEWTLNKNNKKSEVITYLKKYITVKLHSSTMISPSFRAIAIRVVLQTGKT